MKKTLFIIFLLTLGCTFTLFAQDAKKEAETIKTKMDAFSSKTGTITKFIDTKLPNLKTSYSSPETRIRKISNTNISAYFYQIEKEGKYSNNTASIEYSDLLEVIKALSVLKVDESKDIALNPDYLENKFVTVDGFQIGYFVSKGKSTWYIKLEKYGSDNTVFINDVNIVEAAFTEAKNKIEELKK
ncbi:hypothetical protein D0T53_03355 [Dysgonomonas sp. 216]|uniref:hypothetical protein n=1 Tax=Dysgonomonas sp. 216 TaxID=2302934 RepID=UPI0013D226DD|nr:hypothetical protein [Dysgonomonas sp. 216]NDW17954.1 hypothetical protein [Dysgonomonas sp. 216]